MSTEGRESSRERPRPRSRRRPDRRASRRRTRGQDSPRRVAPVPGGPRQFRCGVSKDRGLTWAEDSSPLTDILAAGPRGSGSLPGHRSTLSFAKRVPISPQIEPGRPNTHSQRPSAKGRCVPRVQDRVRSARERPLFRTPTPRMDVGADVFHLAPGFLVAAHGWTARTPYGAVSALLLAGLTADLSAVAQRGRTIGDSSIPKRPRATSVKGSGSPRKRS